LQFGPIDLLENELVQDCMAVTAKTYQFLSAADNCLTNKVIAHAN
jgi:hypothetical protein